MPRSFSLDAPGPIRTIIPVTLMAGDEVEVTTDDNGHGGWRTEAVRRWRTSSDGVLITCEETDPVPIHTSDVHPEMHKMAAHAHAMEYLAAMIPAKPLLRQLFVRGRIGAPGEVRDLERADHARDAEGEPLGSEDVF